MTSSGDVISGSRPPAWRWHVFWSYSLYWFVAIWRSKHLQGYIRNWCMHTQRAQSCVVLAVLSSGWCSEAEGFQSYLARPGPVCMHIQSTQNSVICRIFTTGDGLRTGWRLITDFSIHTPCLLTETAVGQNIDLSSSPIATVNKKEKKLYLYTFDWCTKKAYLALFVLEDMQEVDKGLSTCSSCIR